MSDVEEKGCPICRDLWYKGAFPPKIATNLQLHAHLHRCPVCGTYWEQGERYAEPVSEAEARADFPDAF